jgi:hypothetical protein
VQPFNRFPEGVRYAHLGHREDGILCSWASVAKVPAFHCCGFWTLSDPVNGSYEICPVCLHDRLRPTLRTFEIVAGETEELPRGDVRDLWHPAALAAKDVEVAAYEAQVTNEVYKACHALEALLVLDPPPRIEPNSQPG